MTDPVRDPWSEPVPAAGPELEPVRFAVPSTGVPVESDAPDTVPPKPPRTPTAALGWMALGIAVLFAIADVVAVALAVERSWETATLIAQASNLGTAIAFLAGLFALGRRPSRRLGIAAMVLAVLANPFILTHLLGFLSGS